MKRYLVAFLCAVVVFNIAATANAALETETQLTVPTPKNIRGAAAHSVSCVSEKNCVAVGFQEVLFSQFSSSATVRQSMAMSWNGKRWTIVPSPNLGSNESNFLISVSCVPTGYCKAIGVWSQKFQETSSQRMPKLIEKPLAMSWDGATWSLDSTDSLPDFSALRSISCVSSTSCVSAGVRFVNKTPTSSKDSYPVPMIAKWDGVSWTQELLPSEMSSIVGDLSSISCVSIAKCVTVGSISNGMPLSLTWNGTSWVSHFPSVSVENAQLSSVSCSSEIFCVAVGTWGYASTTSAIQNLSLAWNGNSWAQLTTPAFNLYRSDFLRSVSCRAPDECLAVGHSDGVFKSLVWNGQIWSIMQTSTNRNIGRLGSVSCQSRSFCMAVGETGYSELVGNPTAVLLGPFLMKSKVKKTLTSSSITKAGKISTPKGSRTAISITLEHRKICRVIRNTVKTVGKGICPLSIVVITKSKQKTATFLNIKVR